MDSLRARLRSPSGYRVDRERDGVQQGNSKTPLHPAGGLVRQEEPWIIQKPFPWVAPWRDWPSRSEQSLRRMNIMSELAM